MRNLLIDLRKSLNILYPTFVQLPPEPVYPHITLEPEQNLKGLPWGPHILMLNLMIWSRYKGSREILMMTKKVENALQTNVPQAIKAGLKITESHMLFHKDTQTRTHTFRLKIRYQESYYD